MPNSLGHEDHGYASRVILDLMKEKGRHLEPSKRLILFTLATLLERDPTVIGFSEHTIATFAGLASSTVRRYLQDMAKRGFVSDTVYGWKLEGVR